MDEREDINRRKFNVVVLNLAEPDDGSSTNPWNNSVKKQMDIKSFSTVLNESLDMNIGDGSKDIKDAVRIGTKRGDGKARLLKIMFHDLQIKREVLGKAKLLKSGKHSGIYINPDLTPEQRIKDKALRDELKLRRNNGEEGLVIKRGRIERNQTQQAPLHPRSKTNTPVQMPDLEGPSESDHVSDIGTITLDSISSCNSESDGNPDGSDISMTDNEPDNSEKEIQVIDNSKVVNTTPTEPENTSANAGTQTDNEQEMIQNNEQEEVLLNNEEPQLNNEESLNNPAENKDTENKEQTATEIDVGPQNPDGSTTKRVTRQRKLLFNGI